MIFIPSIFIYQSPHSSIFSTVPFSKACNIVFQEFKKESPQKFDNLPVHFGQLEFRESLVKSLLGLDSGVKHSDFKFRALM
jgi:hypothetical protein